MKTLVLFLVSLPVVSLAQTPAQPESASTRVASNSANKSSIEARDIGSRATATSAIASRTTTSPVLDGKTDDPAWRDAQVIDQFVEFEPKKGAQTRFKTEVRVTYDDKNLYILARMFDPAPDSIVSLLSRRDVRTNSEQLKLVIDSYHDKKTAFQFATNPAGVKRDYYVS